MADTAIVRIRTWVPSILTSLTRGSCNNSHTARVPRRSLLQEQLFQLSISTRQMIDQYAQKRWCHRPRTPVRTLTPAAARARRWTRRPPLCQRAGLVHQQLRETAPRNSLTLPFFRQGPHLWRRAQDHRSLTRIHSRRALVVWRKGHKSSN